MKLRNKKTGKILELDYVGGINVGWCDELTEYQHYESIKEFNEEWEDVPEEPKEFWLIDYNGEILSFNKMVETATDRMMKQIGNYFDTREEAEKAVEKLKAFKRLKDKGFKFHEWYKPDGCEPFIVIETNIVDDADNKGLQQDLDLLFGGEE